MKESSVVGPPESIRPQLMEDICSRASSAEELEEDYITIQRALARMNLRSLQ